jgi:hypothetical protein
MQIDESDEQDPNADSSMDESLESDSNVTVERDLQKWKQCLPSLSTEEEMQILNGTLAFRSSDLLDLRS